MDKDVVIIENLDIDAYHKMPGISSSGIKLILDCPKRYWNEYINPDRVPIDKLSYKIGRAVHTLVLEPHLFNEQFYCMTEKVNLTTKEGKAIYKEAENIAEERIILRFDEANDVKNMAESTLKHSVWNKVGEGRIENSFFWNGGSYDTPLKSRPDFYTDKIIIDIKTTNSIVSFSRSIYNFSYHRQAAMQIDALNKFDGKERYFSFFVVEDKTPYLTAWFTLDEDSIKKGREDYLEGASIYYECLKYNLWPGYDEKCRVISLPWWIKNEEKI